MCCNYQHKFQENKKSPKMVQKNFFPRKNNINFFLSYAQTQTKAGITSLRGVFSEYFVYEVTPLLGEPIPPLAVQAQRSRLPLRRDLYTLKFYAQHKTQKNLRFLLLKLVRPCVHCYSVPRGTRLKAWSSLARMYSF